MEDSGLSVALSLSVMPLGLGQYLPTPDPPLSLHKRLAILSLPIHLSPYRTHTHTPPQGWGFLGMTRKLQKGFVSLCALDAILRELVQPSIPREPRTPTGTMQPVLYLIKPSLTISRFHVPALRAHLSKNLPSVTNPLCEKTVLGSKATLHIHQHTRAAPPHNATHPRGHTTPGPHFLGCLIPEIHLRGAPFTSMAANIQFNLLSPKISQESS